MGISSTMLDKPFGRRTLLRGAGALTAASFAPWAGGCAGDDENALTFFFSANPDEAKARMRVVDEFQRQHRVEVQQHPAGGEFGIGQFPTHEHVRTFAAGAECR